MRVSRKCRLFEEKEEITNKLKEKALAEKKKRPLLSRKKALAEKKTNQTPENITYGF